MNKKNFNKSKNLGKMYEINKSEFLKLADAEENFDMIKMMAEAKGIKARIIGDSQSYKSTAIEMTYRLLTYVIQVDDENLELRAMKPKQKGKTRRKPEKTFDGLDPWFDVVKWIVKKGKVSDVLLVLVED